MSLSPPVIKLETGVCLVNGAGVTYEGAEPLTIHVTGKTIVPARRNFSFVETPFRPGVFPLGGIVS